MTCDWPKYPPNTWITICCKIIMRFLPNDAKNILPWSFKLCRISFSSIVLYNKTLYILIYWVYNLCKFLFSLRGDSHCIRPRNHHRRTPWWCFDEAAPPVMSAADLVVDQRKVGLHQLGRQAAIGWTRWNWKGKMHLVLQTTLKTDGIVWMNSLEVYPHPVM